MDASTQFHDTVNGQYTIAAPQASHGGSNNFHFYGPHAPADLAERNPPKPRKPFSTVPFPPDPDFVDRPDILKWMHEKCAKPAARIALVGLGGIGLPFNMRIKSGNARPAHGSSGCMLAPEGDLRSPISPSRTGSNYPDGTIPILMSFGW
ncbi:hypothetical protein VdG1_00960 [Verticillium dahliae VDG1]|nr:hypothetical protein VdG1_00960 [Verticillium dahliae VDG1]